MQHCAIFRNRKNAKGREPKNTGREPGLKGTGSGRFKPPVPPHYIACVAAGPRDVETRNRRYSLCRVSATQATATKIPNFSSLPTDFR